MEQLLINYFSRIAPLTENEKNAILEDMKIEAFKKGDHLLRAGQIPKSNFFVLKGCVRQYYIIDGEEKTANFYLEEEWVLVNTLEGQPSEYFLTCVEDSFVVIGDEERGMRLIQRFPKFQELSRILLEKEIAKQQQLMATYVTDTPMQRYKRIVETRPALIQRVPQYQLASYIGVTPESLSRIRRRLK